ncbi:MAG: hypothetical protein N4A72_23030 [Bacteroidales bacterium]|jgi:hypothetical protein|nr:hypothetical protein [Bacteroidales bacterium]
MFFRINIELEFENYITELRYDNIIFEHDDNYKCKFYLTIKYKFKHMQYKIITLLVLILSLLGCNSVSTDRYNNTVWVD